MQRSYTLVQITDPHLHAVPEGTLLGMNTENSLQLILERVAEEVDAIDLIIATGDIAQDSSVQAYQNFLRFLSPFSAPMRWIPGNHDSRENMSTASAGLNHSEPVVALGDWVVILLDSIVPKKVYGNLADDQLELLEQTLKAYPDKHILLTFHHHPVSMNSRWIDKIGVRNADQLMTILQQYNNIRAVVCGHVHQERDEIINGIRFMSTPSTCVQFEPESDDFSIDTRGPGYRQLVLNPDGSIDTRVSRIEGVDFEIDFSQKGY